MTIVFQWEEVIFLLDDGVRLANGGNLSAVVSRDNGIFIWDDFLIDLGVELLVVGNFFTIVVDELSVECCTMPDFLKHKHTDKNETKRKTDK